jgi:hypothetical protein
MFDETFVALIREAQFTSDILRSGAIQIRHASYKSKGLYFQAFTSLSTGLERIGKLCLILNQYIEAQGVFPQAKLLKRNYGHNLLKIYGEAKLIISKRSVPLSFLHNLEDPIFQNILTVLSAFAEGDRYFNIDLLSGKLNGSNPTSSWYEKVDLWIYEFCVSTSRKNDIENIANKSEDQLDEPVSVIYFSETREMITSVREATYRIEMHEAIAPYRQLFILKIIRFWADLLLHLGYEADAIGKQGFPHFSEIFSGFLNEDTDLNKWETWMMS